MDSKNKSAAEIREKKTPPRPASDTLKKTLGVSSKFLTARDGHQHAQHASSKKDPLRVLSQISKGSTKGTARSKRQGAQDRLNKLREQLQQELIERDHSRVSIDAITEPKTTVTDHAIATESSSLPGSSAAPSMEDIDMVDIDALLTPNPLPAPLPMECDNLTDPAAAQRCTPKPSPDKQDQESHAHKSTKVATNYLENAASFENHIFIVLDSCVYMNEIVSIMDIFRNEVPINKPQPILVVPYKVLQELELVKAKKHDLSPAITKVTKFLHSMLKVRDKRIKGQRPIDTHLELFEMSSPDDSILNCALQVKQVVGNKVVLVSEDRNLLTKALVADIKAYSWKEFSERYDFDTQL